MTSARSLVRRTIEVQIEQSTIATLQMKKPIMSAEIERAVMSALSQYKNRNIWREWGLTYLRKQGSCILLWGPPGTGKTVIATYMCRLLKFGMKKLDLSVFGS